MNVKQVVGILLLLLGIVGLLVGRVTYTKEKGSVDLGPAEIQVKDKETRRIPPTLAALSIGGGIVLTALGSRRK
jgi:hypothetical protein